MFDDCSLSLHLSCPLPFVRVQVYNLWVLVCGALTWVGAHAPFLVYLEPLMVVCTPRALVWNPKCSFLQKLPKHTKTTIESGCYPCTDHRQGWKFDEEIRWHSLDLSYCPACFDSLAFSSNVLPKASIEMNTFLQSGNYFGLISDALGFCSHYTTRLCIIKSTHAHQPHSSKKRSERD